MKNVKKTIAFLLAVALVIGLVPETAMAAKSTKGKVVSVAITKPDTKVLVLKKKKSYKLKTKVSISGKSSSKLKKVTFSSSKKKIATVSKSGKIKAKKNGTTKITVKSVANKKKKTTLKVIVGTPVSKVELDKKTAEASIGDTVTLTAALSPEKPSVKTLSWTSDNAEVATVDDNGVVTCVAEGTATITAKAMDGNGKQDTCTVTVSKKPAAVNPDQPTSESTTEKKTSEEATTEKATSEEATTEEPTTEDTDFYDPTVEYDYNLEDTDSTAEDFDQLSIDVEDSAAYDMKWYDNFEGTSLDEENWNVETHEPGWVNSELQSYNDDGRNIFVKDGNLILRSIREKDEKGNVVISSGRVNTMGNQDYKYGIFEVRAKVPEGKGFLPAFWMMPTNENLYGQWPRCGEIDIMEVMGQETDKLYGTIHYGNPHAESQGTYQEDGKDFASEYHTFTCNWEPGKITWYVDGVKFHEESDWHTTTKGQGTVAYPAPFDQPFYVILNLAVGGSWVGNPDSTTKINPAAFVIDYVKVWQKDKAAYEEAEENVIKPEKPPVELRDPDEEGNYTINGNFAKNESLTDEKDWSFATANSGEATAEIVNNTKLGGSAIKISTTNKGSVDYSVQLLQHDIPLKQGTEYTLTFDAYADEPRTMQAAIGTIGDRGWDKYLNEKINLTTEKQSFTCTFKMSDEDYANARIEFNMGSVEPTSTIYITNVKLKEKGTFDVDNSKTVRADGNCVYNGSFQEGEPTAESKKGMAYWTTVAETKAEATVGVTNLDDGRRFHATVTAKDGATLTGADFQLKQEGLPMLGDVKYDFSFEAKVTEATSITVDLAGEQYPFDLKPEQEKYRVTFTAAAELTDKDLVFNLGTCGEIWLDNIRVEESALIKNGSFNAGLAGFEPYVDSAAKATYVVDSQKEDNAFDITITDTGENVKNDWYIQLKQNNVPLVKDQCYKLSFDIKSSIDRKVKYAISKDGSKHSGDWTPYAEDVVSLEANTSTEAGGYTHIEKLFRMEKDSDPESVFNITMGSIGGTRITTQHRICIDNIVLEEIDESEVPTIPSVKPGVEMLKNPNFADGGKDWEAYINEKDGAMAESAFADGKAEFNISKVGTADSDVQLKQEGITLETGCDYIATFKVTSTEARTIKLGFLDPQNDWDWYGGTDIALTANEAKTVKCEFTVGADKKTRDTIIMAVSMGKMEDEDTPASTITLSDFSLKKVEKQTEEPDEPDEPVKLGEEMLTNPDFADEGQGWGTYIATGEGAEAQTVFADGKVKFTISKVGTDESHVQLKQEGITLEKGKTYQVSFKAGSDTARTIKLAFCDPDNEWKWYGGEDAIALTADGVTNVKCSFIVSEDTSSSISLLVSMGKLDENTPDTSVIELSDFSLKEVIEETITPVEPVEPGVEMLKNPNFEDGEKDWEPYIDGAATAEAAFEGGKAEFTISNVGEKDWHVQLKQSGITLEKGCDYMATFKVTSTGARTIKLAFLDGSNGWYGGTDIALEKETEKTVECPFTVSADTNKAITMVVSMGQIQKEEGEGENKTTVNVPTPASTITLSGFSLKKVAKQETPAGENMLKNVNFSNDGEGWGIVVGGGADAEGSFSDGKAVFKITDPGTANWNVQLSQAGINLEKGCTYVVTFDAVSTEKRSIEVGFLSSDDGNYYGGGTDELPESTTKTVRVEFKSTGTDLSAVMKISMGKIGEETPVGSTITLSNFKLIKVVDTQE